MGDENLNVEGVGTGAGGGETPTSQPSAQTPPAIEGMAEQLLTLLAPKLTEQINELTKPYLGQLEGLKKVQSDIDRSRNEFREQLKRIEQLKTERNLSTEQALEVYEAETKEKNEIAELRKEFSEIKNILLTGGGNLNQQPTVEKVFEKYGLDLKHPMVSPELTKRYKSESEMEMAALKLFHQIQTSPNPNAAQNPSLNGGGGGRNNKKDISNINDSSALYDLAAQDMFGG